MIRSPLHATLLMGCSMVLALVSEHCPIAGLFLLHPSSKQCASRVSSFLWRISELLVEGPGCLSFSCVFSAKLELIEKRQIHSVIVSSTLRVCSGLSHLRGHTPSSVRLLSLLSPLLWMFGILANPLSKRWVILTDSLKILVATSRCVNSLHD